MSTVVLYCWCHSDSATFLLYFTFIRFNYGLAYGLLAWFPNGDKYIYFDIFIYYLFIRAHANEINQDHSTIVHVVVDPRYDYSYKIYVYVSPFHLKASAQSSKCYIIPPF